MPVSLRLQISFNRKVLEKESEVVPINSGLADFLQGMSITEQPFVAINIGDEIEGEQPVCGQLWVQGER
jgi:hypothetical protein